MTELQRILSIANKLTNKGRPQFNTRDLTSRTAYQFSNASVTVTVAIRKGYLKELARLGYARRFKLTANGKRAIG